MGTINYRNSNGNWSNLILDFIYPIGSYYFNNDGTDTGESVNTPASYFGGSWLNITGRFLYCNNGNSTGGSNDMIIPYHNHDISGGITSSGQHTSGAGSSHSHGMTHGHGAPLGGQAGNAPLTSSYGQWTKAGGANDHYGPWWGTGWSGTQNVSVPNSSKTSTDGESSHTHTVKNHTHTHNISINYAGSSGNTTNANMPAYRTCWAWYRIA